MTDKRKNIKYNSIIGLIVAFAIIAVVNLISTYLFHRFDLTSEKRYSLVTPTKRMLRDLDDIAYFKVYLDGDFPAGFKRLRNETKQMLDEFRAYSDNVQFEFINPSAASDPKEREEMYRRLIESGLNPTNIQTKNEGEMSRKLIFPGAILTYKGKDYPIELLKQQAGVPSNQVLNNSIEALEYTLASALKISQKAIKPKVAFIAGHGELDGFPIADIVSKLRPFYDVEQVRIDGQISSLTKHSPDPTDSTKYGYSNKYKTIVIAKPDSTFSEKDKFIIDQFIMHGGNALFLIDPVYASMDSVAKQNQTLGVANNINMDDFFFNYGVKLKPNLILDLNCMQIPIVTGQTSEGKPQFEMMPWYFFPLILSTSDHPISRNLNAIKTEFISSLESIERPNSTNTILLTSSPYSRIMNTPALISLDMMNQKPDLKQYSTPNLPVAVLIEGTLTSLFKNRVTPDLEEASEIGFQEESRPAKLIVVSDGDIIKNQVRSSAQGMMPFPLGYDQYTGVMFGNRDFILNCLNYLSDDSGLLAVRSRRIEIRMLDLALVTDEKLKWQLINVCVPIGCILIIGLAFGFYRKQKYGRK